MVVHLEVYEVDEVGADARMAIDIDLEDRSPELQEIREVGADEWLKGRSQRNRKYRFSGKGPEEKYVPIMPFRDIDLD